MQSVGITATYRGDRDNVLKEQEPISRTLKVELWIFGAIMVLGLISWVFMMIVHPTPGWLNSGLGVLCILVAAWADGSYRLLGLTVPQTYRTFRVGRGSRFIFSARLLRLVGLGLLVWAWLA